ncbi:putative het domain-containing protein [Diaporthe ampelina]|uniref:Putative het domain-containing protein n=1 Tax=Diaporthe ampelina TaxID=1214573 RepID=A0A0G2F9T4_9PEZI|nr:putative het domain-containing protein [Diaporthe ampelina]
MYDSVSLELGEFRVLQLEPAHDPEDPIVTHLIKARVDNPPMYDALSYRWEGGDSQTVNVNGADLKVTENLYAALRSLRRESHPLPKVLWVDSVCINQSSGPERAEQVPLMGEIYSQAHAVRIWLGEEGPGVGEALKLVRDCGTETSEEVVGRVLGNEEGAKGLTELLHRSYWGRMWMFQEVVLASNAIVHCGGHEASWNSFKWLHDVTAERAFWAEFEVEYPWVGDLRRALFRISLFSIPRDEAQDINAVLIPTRRLQATEPRDKIYGLMGVCQKLAKTVKVDYAAPVRDVYTDFAKAQIESDGELYTLLTAGLWTPENGEDLGIPSWVPDLRGMAGVDTRYLGGAYLETCNADGNGGSSPFFSFSTCDQNNILEVEALVLDSVQVHKKSSSRDEQSRKDLIDSFCLRADEHGFSVSKLRHFFQAIVFEDSILCTATEEVAKIRKNLIQRLSIGFFKDLQHLYGPQKAFIGFLESFSNIGFDLLDESASQLSPDFSPEELQHDELEYLYRTR